MPAFKGRQDVLGALIDLARRTAERRCSVVALVRGESGVGKTRLVREVARRLPRECTVLKGACLAPGTGETDAAVKVASPLHPLSAVLLEAADRARRSDREAERLFGRHQDLLAPYLPVGEDARHQGTIEATPLPPERAKARVIAALRDLLRALAEPSPVVVLLDDLQWADELSLALLESLARDGDDAHPGLFLLGTYRLEEPREELATLERMRGVRVLELEEMDEPSIEEMVAGMLAHREPPRAALEALHRSAGGNPFFVAEFLRTAIEEGLLHRDAQSRLVFDEHVAPSAIASRPTPPTILALLHRRLDLLDPSARRLVSWAAVLGHELDDALVRADPEYGALSRDALAVLHARRIFEAPDGRLRFAHDKLREAAYHRLEEGERRSLHRCAAAALQARHGRRPDKAPALAHHFAGAGLHEEAGEHFALAAQHAAGAYAFRDALRFYPLAFDAFARAGGAPREVEKLHEGFGDALRLLGHQERAREAYRSALERASNALARARLHRKIGKAWEKQHEHAAALDCLSKAEAELGDRGSAETAEWLEIQFDRTSVHYWQANIGALDEILRAVRPVVRAQGDPLWRAHYLHSMTQRNLLSSRFVASKKTVDIAVECVDTFERAGKKRDEDWSLIARSSLAVIRLLHGDLERAEQELYEALPTAAAIGDLSTQIRCQTYLAVARRRRGFEESTADLARRTLQMAEAEHVREYMGAALGNLAWCALRRGDAAQVEELARRAISLWGELTLVYPFEWLARLPLCRVELDRGRMASAVEHVEYVLSESQQRLPSSMEGTLRVAQRAFAEGRAEAVSALDLALQIARRSGHA